MRQVLHTGITRITFYRKRNARHGPSRTKQTAMDDTRTLPDRMIDPCRLWRPTSPRRNILSLLTDTGRFAPDPSQYTDRPDGGVVRARYLPNQECPPSHASSLPGRRGQCSKTSSQTQTSEQGCLRCIGVAPASTPSHGVIFGHSGEDFSNPTAQLTPEPKASQPRSPSPPLS